MAVAKISAYMKVDFEKMQDSERAWLALQMMAENELDCIVIIDSRGKAIDLLTEVSLLELRRMTDAKDAILRDVIGIEPVIFLSPDDHMEEAARRFQQVPTTDQIVITRRNQAVGILRKTDVLRWIQDTLDE